MVWIPIPFPISIQFTLPATRTVKFFCHPPFMQQKAMSADVCHSALGSHPRTVNKAALRVPPGHPISKMAIFL